MIRAPAPASVCSDPSITDFSSNSPLSTTAGTDRRNE